MPSVDHRFVETLPMALSLDGWKSYITIIFTITIIVVVCYYYCYYVWEWHMLVCASREPEGPGLCTVDSV